MIPQAIHIYLFTKRSLIRIGQMVLFGKIAWHTTTICPTRFALQLQKSGFTAVPAAARRERPSERGERHARKAIAALRIAGMPRRQVDWLIAAIALVRVEQSPLTRRRRVAHPSLSGFDILTRVVRSFQVHFAVTRWQGRRPVGYDLNEGRVQARRD